ncbi:MAG: glycosyltransferase, partial [Desulforhopalus sp.]|nr:glycosyltransferase [Desulforhopalus sp.]
QKDRYIAVKVTIISAAWPDFPGSHHATFVREITLGLASKGFDLTVITPKIYDESLKKEKDGPVLVKRFSFPSGGLLLSEHKRVPVIRMGIYFVAGIFTALWDVIRRKSAIIHAHWAIPTGTMGTIVSFLTRRPLVVSVHGGDVAEWGNKPYLRPFLYFALRSADAITTNNPRLVDSNKLNLSENKVHLIYAAGVDTNTFHPSNKDRSLITEHGLQLDQLTILCVANYIERKGQDRLIKALTELPGVQAVLIGAGQERDALEDLVKQHGLSDRIKILGAIKRELLPPWFRACDLFVLPSRYEAMGVVLLEALASGLPVVAARVGGIPNIIEHGRTGLLFENHDELVNSMRKIIHNEGLRKKLAAQGLVEVERRFSLSKQVEHMANVYHSVLR